jgi:tetratricopeptide (TPR) repeat protein
MMIDSPETIDTIADGHISTGVKLFGRGKIKRAITCFEKAMALDPQNVDAHYHMGMALSRLGELKKAVARFRSALEINPNFFQGWFQLGLLLMKTDSIDHAITCLLTAVEICPDDARAYFRLGNALAKQNHIDLAIASYREAIRCDPNHARAHNNIGVAFSELGDFDEAICWYQKALEINPDSVEGYYNIGNALKRQNLPEKAAEYYRKFLALSPDDIEACIELANVLVAQGDIEAAITYFDRALAIHSNHPVARWNRSVAHLLSGNFDEGWKDFDWRQQLPGQQVRGLKDAENNRWDGGSFTDKRLLIYSEHGLGDTLQFVRYLPTVKALGGAVILGTYKPLLPLLKNCEGIDHLVELPANECPSLNYDLCLPVMSLPVVFHTALETIPAQIPYLKADPLKTAAWRHRFNHQAFRVGIVWKGSPSHANDRNRSCRLEQFLPLMNMSGILWYGLQKGPGAEEVHQIESQFMIDNLGEELEDFGDTAAVLENLDLLISVDTAVVHLAGAMGKSVWTLLPYAPDWRWQRNRDDSPWYPSMWLYRQPARGDWTSVFEQVAEDLQQLVKKQSA